MAKQNNELLMKNHEARLTGFAPFPKVNATVINNNGQECGRGRGHGCDRDRNTSSYHKYAPYQLSRRHHDRARTHDAEQGGLVRAKNKNKNKNLLVYNWFRDVCMKLE